MPEREPERLLVWRVGTVRCAAPLASLSEVVSAGTITPVPGAPAGIRGLANVRGRVVTVVDGCALAGVPSDGSAPLLVLVQAGGRTLGLAVDDVEDLVADAAGVRVLDLEALLAPFFPE